MITDIDNLLKDALREAIVEINSLKQQLNQGQLLFAQVRAGLAALESQPRLQRVTPEAMAELEGREIRTIAVLSQGSAKTMLWNTRLFQWCSAAGFDNPLEWDWFIDLSTIPEVTV